MTPTEHLFEDIEQDNNPSFYGDQSILNNPYKSTKNGGIDDTLGHDSKRSLSPADDLMNSTLGISTRIQQLIDDPNLKISVISTERLVNSTVIVYFIKLSIFDDNDDDVNNNNNNGSGSDNQNGQINGDLSTIVVKRRYSEFKSFRDNLLKLFPTLIIPPIPEKHSIFSYLINSINNDNELSIIEMRKRYFTQFLQDLIFNSDENLKHCKLIAKFFDPNYESCWQNALNEPPVNLIPNNLLLANPIDPTDQNGLYCLLPMINGFEFNSNIDNLSSLKKINDDLLKLQDQKKLYNIKRQDLLIYNENSMDKSKSILDNETFNSIPKNLVSFEMKLHKLLKILTELHKVNSKSTKNYKSVINILIDLGANLNNFSLQVFDNTNIGKHPVNNNLSLIIERFGSTIDSNFLNFESFLIDSLIPEWQEPIHQLIQYYFASLNLIKFYKFKIIQFKLLYKLKFKKFQQLLSFLTTKTINSPENVSQTLDHLKDLNSPTINQAIQNIKSQGKQTPQNKKSWYGMFGGNNTYNKHYSKLIDDDSFDKSNTSPIKFKLVQIEKELNKLDQLIELSNNDMTNLTNALTKTYIDFLKKMEKRWLVLMIDYIKNGKKLFHENLSNFTEFKTFLTESV